MRSTAEQEIRDAVVSRLRERRPGARICHEVNCGIWGPNRMDLIAVSKDEIIAVEIKSERDTLKRAVKQLGSMGTVAHWSVLALHEVHLVEKPTNEWAAHYGKMDGQHYLRDIPEQASGSISWVYPERERSAHGYDYNTGLWRMPEHRMGSALPSSALHLLWRDELAWLCDHLRVSRGKRANMTDMTRALWWHATGRELTEGICAALRRRKFAEADAAIIDDYAKTAGAELPLASVH